jgi:uncharacterized membrane protein
MQSKIPNWLLGTIIAVALVGFSDSVFLFSKTLSGGPIPCFITTGCDTVSTSSYSKILGIPVSGMGVAFYLAMGFRVLLYWDIKKDILLKIFSGAAIIGFIMSVYFFYLQAFVIHAFCSYCLGSTVTSSLLFILGLITLRKLRS